MVQLIFWYHNSTYFAPKILCYFFFKDDSLNIIFNFILGLLFLRDLVMVDPDDRIEVSTVTNYYKHQLKDIDENTKLDDMLEIFKVRITLLFGKRWEYNARNYFLLTVTH